MRANVTAEVIYYATGLLFRVVADDCFWGTNFLGKLLHGLKNVSLGAQGNNVDEPSSVTNSWQQVLPRDDFPPFDVAKKVSMKKYLLIRL